MVPNKFGPHGQMVPNKFTPCISRSLQHVPLDIWNILGTICLGGPNWLVTICPWAPNFWGASVRGDLIGWGLFVQRDQLIGDPLWGTKCEMSGVHMRLGPNVLQPNILCGIYNYAKGNFKPKISYIFHFECIKVVWISEILCFNAMHLILDDDQTRATIDDQTGATIHDQQSRWPQQ